MSRCYWDPGTGRVKAIRDEPDSALDRSWNYVDLPASVDLIAREQAELRRNPSGYVRYNPISGSIAEITFDPSAAGDADVVSCPRPLAERIIAGQEDAEMWVCGLDENNNRILKPATGALRTIYTETKNFVSVGPADETVHDIKITASVGKDGTWELQLVSRWPVGAVKLPSDELKFVVTAPDDPALLLAVFSVPYEELATQETIKGELGITLPDEFAIRVRALEPSLPTHLAVVPAVATKVPLPPRPFEDLVRLERTEHLQDDALVAQPVSRGIRLSAATNATRYDRMTDRVSVMVTPRGNPGVLLHTIEAPIAPLLAGDEVVIPLSPRWLGEEYDLWTPRLWVNARRIDLKRKWTKTTASD